MKPRLFRLSYFIWLIVPAGLYAAYLTYGLPHGRFSYVWIDQGHGLDPFADRYYTHCRYIGPYGSFDVYPRDGQCAWIRFYFAPDAVDE
ncbi:MAG: hypothetical protein KDF64_19850 [Geminicoccaceae bacterium]|nr:hypothetical protein [Geminicoccaceae bacterium]